jgi:hypothetical protein
MSENFLSTLSIKEAASSPAGLLAGPYQIHGSNSLIRTRPITTLTRKDPWRSSAESLPVLVEPSFAWACDVGDSIASDIILDAMGDPTRSTEAGNTRTWKIGRADDVRRFDVWGEPVEGGDIRVTDAGLSTAQLVIERGRIASWVTDWVGWQILGTAPAWTPEELTNTTYATAVTTTVTVDGETLRVFSGAVNIGRQLQAANFSQDGAASVWAGALAFDVVGRLALRLEASDAIAALQGQILTREIVIEMVAGTRTRTITLPKCSCEIRERRLHSQGTYEHILDFAVLREEGEDVMTVTSTTP